MLFSRTKVDYGDTPYPETPFQKVAQLVDAQNGAREVQTANWRYIAFGCLGLAFLSTGGFIWSESQSSITPYVVEVDKLGGVQAVAPAEMGYDPTDAQIAHHLANLISNVRGLSIDPVVVKQNWLDAYAYTTDKGALVLNQYARENDPFADVGRRSREVEVTSVVRVSDDSFQTRWVEKTYENHALTQTHRYTGLMTVIIETPSDADALMKNPLGIYVHGLNWGQDLISGAAQ